MWRLLIKPLLMLIMVIGGGYAVFKYEQKRSTENRLREQVQQLEQQKQHLQQFITRLTAEKRVAEVLVTEQVKSGERIESTTLMFVEYGRDNVRLPPRFFTIKGNVAHFDALVVKFDRQFIEIGDGLRGHSLVLFYRAYGDYQTPADGFRIDQPGQSPAYYQPGPDVPPSAQEFEAELWRNFWKLVDDADYRQTKGVRLAQGESPWTYFYPDRIYTLTTEADGGLNISSRPIDGVWKEYLAAVRRPRPLLN